MASKLMLYLTYVIWTNSETISTSTRFIIEQGFLHLQPLYGVVLISVGVKHVVVSGLTHPSKVVNIFVVHVLFFTCPKCGVGLFALKLLYSDR